MTTLEVGLQVRSRGVVAANDVDAASTRSEPRRASDAGTADLLPDPFAKLEASGDLGAMLAAMVVRSGQADRRAHDAARASEEAAQERAESAQVQALHDEASATRAGAWVSGVATVAEGACSAASVDSRLPKQDVAGAEAAGRGVRGVGDALGGLYKAVGEDRHADAAEAEHAAGRAKSRADDDAEGSKRASALIDKALSFYKEYLATKSEIALTVARRA